nr:PREDICTED: uncharacterized protein LOC107398873 [Tribolium castaneum]|eukprot:XP_015839910.1 PREDICTED: uncharacterized protein LOC107398873 [Tribolium castaneum]
MFRRLKSHFEKNKSTSFQDTSTDGLMNCVSLTSSSSSSTSLPLGLMTPAKETSNFFQEKSTDRCEKDNNKKSADFFRIIQQMESSPIGEDHCASHHQQDSALDRGRSPEVQKSTPLLLDVVIIFF